MKRATSKTRPNVREKLAAYEEARNQAKLDLLKAARTAAADNHWPQFLWPDGSDDAWFHRKSAVSELIEKRGLFSHHVATLALTDSDWESKETVASWLRSELKVLRDAEAESGTAPVRRGGALSKTVISDVAIELLEGIGGESLVCLFQELLDIDRHRKSLAEGFAQLDRAAEAGAQLELQGVEIGVRAFAKHLSVSPSTVTRWRKSPAFRQRVDFHKNVWGNILRDEYFDQIRKDASVLSEAECFRRAFQLYGLSIPLRQAGISTKANEPLAGVAQVQPPTAPMPTAKKSRRDSG
jgi:hypothetical protein